MNKEELEGLKRRFGPDASVWPAPYRQEARSLHATAPEGSSAPAAELDRLILEAAGMETDERALARKVQERIEVEREPFLRFGPLMSPWRTPAITSCVALILVATAFAGYSAAGRDHGHLDEALLALAAGDPAASGIDAPSVPLLPETLGDGDIL
ncbi:hypothetical protein [Lutibaculum baratangense]|uniref:Uncharacterized protein n=1 Tax=Lutibaculum baratangense AMV1 TaxID=631454 RepID=V4RBG5_9HYPH|nr:hypothetical protein [Lutibaculum baratangense]ESR23481.1 hypothetical protein N177_3549 [Lutibaculum baratangense AMV1]